MKCDLCDKQATVHLIEIVNGQKIEKHLCEHHAAEAGIIAKSQPLPPINQLVEQFLAGNPAKQTADSSDTDPANPTALLGMPSARQLTCEHCGLTYPEFRKSGLLGCPHCYDAFAPVLTRLLERAHEGTCKHVGKTPSHADTDHTRQARLLQLRQQLAEAVENEQYEKAARIRDGIRQIEARTR